MEISKYKTDPKLEAEGVEVQIAEGTVVKVARIGSPRYNERLNALMRPHRHAQAKGTLDDETQTKIVVKVMAETVLLGWRGITDKGIEIPYSRENAEQLLAIRDFREQIVEIANGMEAFRAQGDEVAEGNS